MNGRTCRYCHSLIDPEELARDLIDGLTHVLSEKSV